MKVLVLGIGGAGKNIIGHLKNQNHEGVSIYSFEELNGAKEYIQNILEKHPSSHLLLVFGLGGLTSEHIIKYSNLIPHARKENIRITFIGIWPFEFEGLFRKERAENTLLFIKNYSNQIHCISTDYVPKEGISKAFERLDQEAIRILCKYIQNCTEEFVDDSLYSVSLTKIRKNDEKVYVDEYGVVYSDDKMHLIKAPQNLAGTYSILPGTLSISGWAAFFECNLLETIIIPESMITIESNAFSECARLKSLYIPTNIQRIDSPVCFRCPALEKIDVAPTNPYYTSINGILYSKSLKCLVRVPEKKSLINFRFPNQLREVGAFAFSANQYLTNISIPDHVNIIRWGSFYECKCLEEIRFPDCKIGSCLFVGCDELKTIRIPKGNDGLYGQLCTYNTKIPLKEGRIITLY